MTAFAENSMPCPPICGLVFRELSNWQGYRLELVREPHVRHLEGPLWEMRMKGRDGISRAISVTAQGRRIVIVRVFVKKTPKTPRRELDLAWERAKEIPKK